MSPPPYTHTFLKGLSQGLGHPLPRAGPCSAHSQLTTSPLRPSTCPAGHRQDPVPMPVSEPLTPSPWRCIPVPSDSPRCPSRLRLVSLHWSGAGLPKVAQKQVWGEGPVKRASRERMVRAREQDTRQKNQGTCHLRPATGRRLSQTLRDLGTPWSLD